MHVGSLESTKEVYELLEVIDESNSSFFSALRTSQVNLTLRITSIRTCFCRYHLTTGLFTKRRLQQPFLESSLIYNKGDKKQQVKSFRPWTLPSDNKAVTQLLFYRDRRY